MENKFISILLFYIVAWCIAPPLAYGGIFRLLALGAVCLICFIFLLKKKGRLSKAQIACVILVLYIVLLTFITGDSLSFIIGTLIMLAFLFMSESLFNDGKYFKEQKWFITAVFLMCIVFNITTLIGLAEEPNIMRVLAKNVEDGASYARRGIGGYGYMYTIIVLIPFAIKYLFDEDNKPISRIIAGMFLVTGYILAFNSQYFLVILIAIFIPIMLIVFRIKKQKTKIIMVFSFIVIFLLLFFNADIILELIMKPMSSTSAIYKKLDALYDMIHGISIEDTEFSGRFDRYVQSINMVLESPFWGKFSFIYCGRHSSLLDFLAQYGLIIGGVLCYVIYILPFNKMEGLGDYKKIARLIFTVIVLFNVVPYATVCVLMIVVPIYNQILNKRGEK